MKDKCEGKAFAISDIHGCAQTFAALIFENLKIKKGDSLFLLGDLINRGPDSKSVLDLVMHLREEGVNTTYLRGNHEEIFLNALSSGDDSLLKAYGGSETLKSFGVERVGDIPKPYIDLIASSEFYTIYDRYILVHAGLNLKSKDPFSDRKSMLWERNMKNNVEIPGNRILVHGHTPWLCKEIKAQLKKKTLPTVINIDGGCVYERSGHCLCALNLENLHFYFEKKQD